MVPALIAGIAQVIGRHGESCKRAWMPLSGAATAFILTLGVVLGFIVLG